MTSPLTTQQQAALKPLAAVIETAIAETPIRLGTNDWGTVLAARVLADVAAFMGRTLGPDAPVLAEIQAERERQDAKWGEQNHPDGTGGLEARRIAAEARANCQAAAERGTVTWLLISDEEHCEALAESDPVKLRAELIQDAAVKVAWIAAIDRRLAAVSSVV
jgi:hypothetical protein